MLSKNLYISLDFSPVLQMKKLQIPDNGTQELYSEDLIIFIL